MSVSGLANIGPGRVASVILVVLIGCLPAPAAAFELFGIHLWGEPAVDEEIIEPLPYAVTLVVHGDDSELVDRIGDASILIAREDDPPSGTVGLVSRARDEREGLLAALYQNARYGGTVAIDIAGRPLETISVTEALGRGAEPVPVRITVDPGPVFVFGNVVIEGGDPGVNTAAAVRAGLEPGAPARSGIVAAAEAALVLAWQRLGHPFAGVGSRDLIADHARQALDVRLTVIPGQAARLGRVAVVGADDVDPAFLARHAVIPYGHPYHPDALERARTRLAELPALGSVVVRPAERLDPDGTVPIIIEVSERKKRTIGAGATYSSTEGAGVEAFWVHRNLFGQSETLRLEGSIERLLSADSIEEHDALLAVAFSKPGFLDPLLTLDLRAGVLQEDPNPYERRTAYHEGMLSYEFSQDLTGRIGYIVETSRIDDAFGRSHHTLVGVPAIADYDSRDSILDPTRGIFARVIAEPLFPLDGGSPFVRADSELRLYHRVFDRRVVLAARGRAGTIIGSDLADVPAHRRFFAGGGGSVRGYDYLNIGPRIPGRGATGGLSRLEGSAEARIRVSENWSFVPFVDAGYVARTSDFSGFDELRVGVGAGVRYHTAVGPLRFDLAVPLDPHRSDPDFAVYLGIGQAF